MEGNAERDLLQEYKKAKLKLYNEQKKLYEQDPIRTPEPQLMSPHDVFEFREKPVQEQVMIIKDLFEKITELEKKSAALSSVNPTGDDTSKEGSVEPTEADIAQNALLTEMAERAAYEEANKQTLSASDEMLQAFNANEDAAAGLIRIEQETAPIDLSKQYQTLSEKYHALVINSNALRAKSSSEHTQPLSNEDEPTKSEKQVAALRHEVDMMDFGFKSEEDQQKIIAVLQAKMVQLCDYDLHYLRGRIKQTQHFIDAELASGNNITRLQNRLQAYEEEYQNVARSVRQDLDEIYRSARHENIKIEIDTIINRLPDANAVQDEKGVYSTRGTDAIDAVLAELGSPDDLLQPDSMTVGTGTPATPSSVELMNVTGTHVGKVAEPDAQPADVPPPLPRRPKHYQPPETHALHDSGQTYECAVVKKASSIEKDVPNSSNEKENQNPLSSSREPGG